MSELPKGYRRYEEFAKGELERRGCTISSTDRSTDIRGIDLVGKNPKGKSLGVYARARFGGYKDVTFNGAGALQKLAVNCEKYDTFVCVLHYATGSGFTDPASEIYQTTFIDLKKWAKTCEYDWLKMKDQLIYKTQNDGFFIMPKEVWSQYVFGTEVYDPPASIGINMTLSDALED